MPKFDLIRMEGLRTYGRQVEANTWREAEQQCRDCEIVNGELIGVYDCDPVTEAVCTARNDVMIESLGGGAVADFFELLDEPGAQV
ncbi:hypothetical protein, partial [Pseudomonas aeruginosa]|uniref:hypothetical protein n=1 Tax=Pseudomonas aeruginosa TaxID=287 RepID=UPI003BF5FCF0